MPNIASLLKSEISRVARKEIRAHNEALAKSSRGHRAEIAALKRRVHELESSLKKLSKGAAKQAPAATEEAGSIGRFSAKGLASNRKRLGLSAGDFGKLVGASGNTIYNWESGASRPRASFHAAIAELRGIGKREVTARLEAAQAGNG